MVSVIKGFDQTFAFEAEAGYEINDVIVDGESYGAITSYTFEGSKKHILWRLSLQKLL